MDDRTLAQRAAWKGHISKLHYVDFFGIKDLFSFMTNMLEYCDVKLFMCWCA